MFDERPEIQQRLGSETLIWLTTVHRYGPAPDIAREVPRPGGPSRGVLPRVRASDPRHPGRPEGIPDPRQLSDGRSAGHHHGLAGIVPEGPPIHEDSEYLAKYEQAMAREGTTPESFPRDYAVPILDRPTRLRSSCVP